MLANWILVADSSAARIYAQDKRGGPLKLVAELSHPESRARSGDVYAGAPGRVHDRMGAGRHAVEPRTDLHAAESQRFAQEIAHYLETAHHERKFAGLVLMAPPAFLGALRAALGKGAAAVVRGEVAKNLLAQDEASIAAHLP